jgi:hypothetical protein
VKDACSAANSWLSAELAKLEASAKHVDPCITCKQMEAKARELSGVCAPVMNKKKPPPPKEEQKGERAEEAPEEPAAVPAAADAADAAPTDAETAGGFFFFFFLWRLLFGQLVLFCFSLFLVLVFAWFGLGQAFVCKGCTRKLWFVAVHSSSHSAFLCACRSQTRGRS